jgi:hypothetical protein
MQTDFALTLPRFHAGQLAAESHPAKRKVVNAGRRWGKTTLACEMAIKRMLAGARCLIASTTQEQADVFWDYSKMWLAELVAAGIIDKNETRRTLGITGGGRLHIKTGSDPDVLRGDYADFLVLDECALLDPMAWELVGAPMLLDTNGEALFLSTPKGMNWFERLFQRGLQDDGQWKSWHFTSLDNPYLSKEALTQLKEEMPVGAHEQELLAHFVDLEGSSNALIPYHLAEAAAKRQFPADGNESIFGIDVARFGDDKTVVVERQGKLVPRLWQWSKTDLVETERRILALIDQIQPAAVNVDDTGLVGLYDHLNRHSGYRSRPLLGSINFGAGARSDRFANLRAEGYMALAKRFEDGDIAILNDTELLAQLCSMRYRFNAKGRLQIESKEDMKSRGLPSPDKADALMLAFLPRHDDGPVLRWL